MDVEEQVPNNSYDFYDPRQIEQTWSPIHKIILRNYENDSNLFFTYFNNSYEHLNLLEPWTQEDKIRFLEQLYKLYKSKISPIKGIWGIFSLKFNRKNGLMCFQYYSQLRLELLSKRFIEQFKENLKIAINLNKSNKYASINIEEDFEKELCAFKQFFIEDLNQLTTKLAENVITDICKILGINYFDISCRVKARVDQLAKWLDKDDKYLQSPILKKDPLKNINKFSSTTSLIVKSLNQAIKDDNNLQDQTQINRQNKNVMNEDDQQGNDGGKISARKPKNKQINDSQMIAEEIQDVDNEDSRRDLYQDQNKLIQKKRDQQKQQKKRRTKIDFDLIKPIFEGEYESEPELSFTHHHHNHYNKKQQAIDKLNITCPLMNIVNNNNTLQQQQQQIQLLDVSAISFSTNDNISQLSFWSLKEPEINRGINDIDDKYEFDIEDESQQQVNTNQTKFCIGNDTIFKDFIETTKIEKENEQLGNSQSQYSFLDENSVNPFDFEKKLTLQKAQNSNNEENNNYDTFNMSQTSNKGIQDDVQSFKTNDNVQLKIDKLKKIKKGQSNEQQLKKEKQVKKKTVRKKILSRKEKKAKLQVFKEQLLEENDLNYKQYKETKKRRKVENAVKKFQQENKQKRDPKEKYQSDKTNIMRLTSKKILNTNRNMKNNPIKERNIITQNQIIQKYQSSKTKEQKRVDFQLQKQANISIKQGQMLDESETQQNQSYTLNDTQFKRNYSGFFQENGNDVSIQEEKENFEETNKINKRVIKKSELNMSLQLDKKVSQKFKVDQNISSSGIQMLEDCNSENINQYRYQKTYRQQTINDSLGFVKIQKSLILALKNKEQLIYYKIKDVEIKRDQTKDNLAKNKSVHINNALLEQATQAFKIENFNKTYTHSDTNLIRVLFDDVLNNQFQEQLDPKKVENFKLEAVSILRNQLFWDRQTYENRNYLIYLFYLLTVAIKNDEFREYYHEFIYKNYIMSSYKFIGITLLNVCLHLMNGGTLPQEQINTDIEKSNNMDIESTREGMQQEYSSGVNNDSPQKETRKVNNNYVSQEIHDIKDNLEEISNQIIIFSEMIKQLSKRGNAIDFDRQVNLFQVGANFVHEIFKLCQSDEIIAERLFQQYPKDICSLNTDNLDLSFVLLYYLFYACNVSTKDNNREKFVSNLKRSLNSSVGTSQCSLAETIFEESAIHFFSIFQNIFSQKDKISILLNLIEIHKEQDKLINLLLNNTFVSSIEITPELITKVSQKIAISIQQQKKSGNRNENNSGILNENYMSIFREIEQDEDRKEAEENDKSYQNTSTNDASNSDNMKKQDGKQLSSLAFLVKYPSELLSKYFNENKLKMNLKDQKRLYSQIQSIIATPIAPNQQQKDKEPQLDHILMLRDILILKVFIKNIDLSDADMLKNILRKCKGVTANPKYNVFIARTLLRSIYMNLARTLENSTFYNALTQNLYAEIFQTTYSILDFLVEKYLGFTKNQGNATSSSTFTQKIGQSINTHKDTALSIQKDIQNYRQSIKLSVFGAINSINQLLLKSEDFIALFITHFLHDDKFFNFLDPKTEIESEFRQLILQMFYNLYSYPKTIFTLFNSNESLNTLSNLNNNKSQFNQSINQAGVNISSAKTSVQKKNQNLSINENNNIFQESHISTQNQLINQQKNTPILSEIDNIYHLQQFEEENGSLSDSDDDEFIQITKNKEEKYKRLLKIHNIILEINSKSKKLIVEYILSMFNRETMSNLNREFHPNQKTLAASMRVLGCILNSEFQQKPDAVFEQLSSLLLIDKILFTGDIFSSKIKRLLILWKYNLVFYLYKDFLSLHSYYYTIFKQSTLGSSNQLILQQTIFIEKIVHQMVTALFLQLLNSFEGLQVSMITDYFQNIKQFIERVLQSNQSQTLSKIRVFTKLFQMEQNKIVESELDIIRTIIKNLKRELYIDQNRYLEKFMLYGVLDQLRNCVTESFLNDQESKHNQSLFKRIMYFLHKLQFSPQEVQQIQIPNSSNPILNLVNKPSYPQGIVQNNSILIEQINSTWNLLFLKEKTQDFSTQKFSLKDPIMLKPMLSRVESIQDFKIMIKFCLKTDYKNFILDLALYLKQLDVTRILLNQKDQSYQIESRCSNLLIETIQLQLEEVHSQDNNSRDKKKLFVIKYLRVLMQNLQEMKCKYFIKNNIQKNVKTNTIFNDVVKIIREVKLQDDDSKRMNQILYDNTKQQQMMMNTFIYILLSLDQIRYLTQANEYQSSFQLIEIESLILTLLNDIILRESFFQIFSSQSEEKVRQIQVLVMRRILQILRKFKKSNEFNSQFILSLNLIYWRYFLSSILKIAQYFDPDIMDKFKQEGLNKYSLIYNQVKITNQFNSYTSPSSFFEIFSQLKSLAVDTDVTFSTLVDMDGCKCCEFLNEIIIILQEKLKILIQIGNINTKLEELKNFLEQVTDQYLFQNQSYHETIQQY